MYIEIYKRWTTHMAESILGLQFHRDASILKIHNEKERSFTLIATAHDVYISIGGVCGGL